MEVDEGVDLNIVKWVKLSWERYILDESVIQLNNMQGADKAHHFVDGC